MLNRATLAAFSGLMDTVRGLSKFREAKYLSYMNPLMAAIFPVVYLYSANIDQIPLSAAGPVMLEVLLGAVIFTMMLRLVLRSHEVTGVVAVVWLLIFLSHGHILEVITGNSIGGFMWGRIRYLMAVETITAITVLVLAVRSRQVCHRITPIISVVLAAAFFLSWASIGSYYIQDSEETSGVGFDVGSIPLSELSQNQLPDIYFIVLDSYPNAGTLDQVFGFDNSPFLEFLKNNGFFVAGQSRANYTLTNLSLASSLNMNYLPTFFDDLDADDTDVSILRKAVKDNQVVLLAKRMGYRFAFLRSNWMITLSNPHADEQLSRLGYPGGDFGRLILEPFFGAEFGNVFARSTILKSFVDSVSVALSIDLFAEKNEKLKQISEMDDPTFTFAHFGPPHPPLIFDRDGNSRNLRFSMRKTDDQDAYLDQLVWVNKTIQETVAEMMRNDGGDSVIVIQGDHGTSFTDTHAVLHRGGVPDGALLAERGGVLNAIHLPESCKPSGLYESITLVNTFRLIFDRCLGTNFGLLEDVFYWSSLDRLYDFTPYP